MPKRSRVIQVGVPALIIGTLALAALWRVGMPPPPNDASRNSPTAAAITLTALADIMTTNAVGRRAALRNVEVRQLLNERALWLGPAATAAFAVLAPDSALPEGLVLAQGQRLSVEGLVRPAPMKEDAMRQWHVDAETAATVSARGVYLYITDITAAP